MPYVMRTTKAGKTIEIEKYYTCRYNKKGEKRGKRIQVTKEQQKKTNSRIAERKLRVLLNENFGFGDLYVTLGYVRKKDEPYRTREEMKKDIELFLRRLREKFKNLGKTLKYIHVVEIGEKGARHHHLVINHIDSRTLQECWGNMGRPIVYPLDDSGQYRRLAAYLIKYSDRNMGTEFELQTKRWNCSRNLKRPEPEYKIITDADFIRADERVPKKYSGKYYVDKESVEKGVTGLDYAGYGYFRFTLVKIEAEPPNIRGRR